MKYKLTLESKGILSLGGIFDSEIEAREYADKITSAPIVWGDDDWNSHLGRFESGCFTVCPFIQSSINTSPWPIEINIQL